MSFPGQAVQRAWHLVDASNQTVGRLSVQVATLLKGTHKPTYRPNADCGDFVVVINAEKVHFSGQKWKDKLYRWHTGYPGGLKERRAVDLHERKPTMVLKKSILGMLRNTTLRKSCIEPRLKIYPGSTHPHTAQLPPPPSPSAKKKKKTTTNPGATEAAAASVRTDDDDDDDILGAEDPLLETLLENAELDRMSDDMAMGGNGGDGGGGFVEPIPAVSRKRGAVNIQGGLSSYGYAHPHSYQETFRPRPRMRPFIDTNPPRPLRQRRGASRDGGGREPKRQHPPPPQQQRS